MKHRLFASGFCLLLFAFSGCQENSRLAIHDKALPQPDQVLPAHYQVAIVRTTTVDNCKEFAGFKELERGLDMRSYFARPDHSWERGTNENTNGLLRQFFPKGMDFGTII